MNFRGGKFFIIVRVERKIATRPFVLEKTIYFYLKQAIQFVFLVSMEPLAFQQDFCFIKKELRKGSEFRN
jgi:hypothetical protein